MARPWEYSRWRRVAMQATMWLILGATLGLAQLVVSHRNRAPSVTLGSPVRLGRLKVRLPQGWVFEKARVANGFNLIAKDPDNSRLLLIRTFTQPQTDEQPEQSEAPALTTESLQFQNLKQTGRLRVFQVPRQTPEGVIRIELLKGDVVLPSGIAITIVLEQYGPRVDPADWILVRALANAMTLGGPAAPVPRSDDKTPDVRMDQPLDKYEIEREGDAMVLFIQTDGRFGGTTLVRKAAWPRMIQFRFPHADGLDSFDASNGRVFLQTNSQMGEEPEVRPVAAADEPDADPAAIVDAKYKTPVLRGDDGVEVTLPPVLYPPDVRELSIHWVSSEK